MVDTATQLAPEQRQFGRYTLLYRFASGGMADIFLARLTGTAGFEKLVALKVIHPHLSRQLQFIEMFVDEARLASRISHPNVAQTIELGRVDDAHFIAMEYVEGESVAALVRRTEVPPTFCARIVADAAAGLHAAHELRGRDGRRLEVVHRDVSPSNILVTYEGVVKVVDFGVARARGQVHSTADGQIKGKIAYMAPEQLASEKVVDRRADVFALGIVLYEITTRRHLFRRHDDATTLNEVLHGEITPPSRLQGCAAYPEALEQVVMKALQRDVDRRHQTAHELQQALERYIIQAQGEPVYHAQIGELMQQTFADHIEEKRGLLQACDREARVVPEVELESASSMGLPGRSGLLAPGRRRWIGLAAAGLALVVLVAVGVYLAVGGRSSTPATGVGGTAARPDLAPVPPDAEVQLAARDTAPPPDVVRRPRRITLDVQATPASAKIEVGGTPVSNPYHLEVPEARGQLEVVVSAPGHETQRFEVSLAKGGKWEIALTKRPETETPKPRPKKPRLGNEDVLVNPYR